MNRKMDGVADQQNDAKSTENVESKKATSFEQYFTALRPWSFSASLTPVILDTTLSWKETGQLSWALAIFVSIAILSVHAAGNLVNTYYDFLSGIDDKESDDQTLVNEILSPEQVVHLGGIIYVTGCICFLTIVALSPSRIEQLAFLFFTGLSGSFFYTGSIGLKYHALGDIVVLLSFGPISVLFSYTAQCGHMSLYPLVCAIPLVMNTEAILHGNNTRDIESDTKAGFTTLAILLGFKLSYLLYFLLLFVPYFIVFGLAVKSSSWFLLPLLSVPAALNLEKDFRFGRLKMIAQDTAKLNLFFGLLYIAAFVLS